MNKPTLYRTGTIQILPLPFNLAFCNEYINVCVYMCMFISTHTHPYIHINIKEIKEVTAEKLAFK